MRLEKDMMRAGDEISAVKKSGADSQDEKKAKAKLKRMKRDYDRYMTDIMDLTVLAGTSVGNLSLIQRASKATK